MFKLLTSFFILNLYFSSTFAGGSGGGVGPRPDTDAMRIDLNFNDLMNLKKDRSIKIIHGQLSQNNKSIISIGRVVDTNWKVQRFEVPTDIIQNSDLNFEIQQSIETNNWVEIKK